MMESLIINNLAGLMVVTSVLIILMKRLSTSIIIFSIQALILVLTLFAIGYHFDAHELYNWGAVAIVTKVILVPVILYKTLTKVREGDVVGSLLPTPVIIILSALIVLLCYFVVRPVNLPLVSTLKPVLAVSLGLFLIGLLCIISQRNILKQILGYCLMENGAHLTLALLAYRVPELVEIGITTDSIFAVIIMSYFVRRIYRLLHTLDANKLNALKG